MSQTYAALFDALTQKLELFLEVVKSKKSTLMATDEWTVKDVLCHIVFWHEQYAANYASLAAHTTPVIPKLSANKLNMPGVRSLRTYSIKQLIERLQTAHASLYSSIVEKKVPRMTYHVGGRTYETDEFLEMICRHFNAHTMQVKRAK